MNKSWLPTVIIIAIFLVMGGLYAGYTPTWQVPDEPAHYNYIRSLAQGRGIPIMQAGDYDQEYLGRLTTEKFPPDLPVDSLEYEDHQPPLYYFLATPVYLAFGGAIFPLRFFSVLWGAVAVLAVMLMTREVFPGTPGYAWLAGGLMAFIPQYVAMMSGINNDALTIALLSLWLWLALRYVQDDAGPLWLSGLLAALLVTKTTGYVAFPLSLLIVALRWHQEHRSIEWAARQFALLVGPAILLGAIWWGRNMNVYGWPDFMGLQRHNAVVAGQPTTASWIARDGFGPFLSGALRTTFRSFWGQFGWMGVVLDTRIYQGLLIFTGLCGFGATWALFKPESRKGWTLYQLQAFAVLGSSALITFVLYIVYNLTFVQHQGRYLFPALPTLALLAALGLCGYTERRLATWTALGLLGIVVALGGFGLLVGDLPLWPMVMVVVASGGVALAGFTPSKYRHFLGVSTIMALVLLDVVCLFEFIIPALT